MTSKIDRVELEKKSRKIVRRNLRLACDDSGYGNGPRAFAEARAQCLARRMGLLGQMQGEEGRDDEELGQACPSVG